MCLVPQLTKASTTCALRVFAKSLTMREPYGTIHSRVGKCLRCVLQWPRGHIPRKGAMQLCWPCRCLNQNTGNQWRDGGREKKRDDRRARSSAMVRWERARWWVCAKTWNMLKRRVCYLFSSPLAIQYLPSQCVVSSLSQGLAGAARENGRKSDPYGGTIKLTADLQASSKPGQGFITTHDWHPPLTPGHCALTLNFSLSPQQHQFSAWPQGCLLHSSKLILLREVS